jgi:hypothetical protein
LTKYTQARSTILIVKRLALAETKTASPSGETDPATNRFSRYAREIDECPQILRRKLPGGVSVFSNNLNHVIHDDGSCLLSSASQLASLSSPVAEYQQRRGNQNRSLQHVHAILSIFGQPLELKDSASIRHRCLLMTACS